MPRPDGKRIVLQQTNDARYALRYDLRVDDRNVVDINALATVYAISGEQFGKHLVLMVRTPFQVRFRVFSEDTPFAVAHNIGEAREGLYKRLRVDAPSIVRQANQRGDKFPAFYDETGMGTRYNYVRLNKKV